MYHLVKVSIQLLYHNTIQSGVNSGVMAFDSEPILKLYFYKSYLSCLWALITS